MHNATSGCASPGTFCLCPTSQSMDGCNVKDTFLHWERLLGMLPFICAQRNAGTKMQYDRKKRYLKHRGERDDPGSSFIHRAYNIWRIWVCLIGMRGASPRYHDRRCRFLSCGPVIEVPKLSPKSMSISQSDITKSRGW